MFHWSSSILAISLLIWCGVQIATTEYVKNESSNLFYSDFDRVQYIDYNNIDQSNLSTINRNRDANSGRSHQFQHKQKFPHRPPPAKRKESAFKKEMLQPGCELDQAWQTPETNSNLLSCQLLHELDLTETFSSASSSKDSRRRRRSFSLSAHLGSGLWRDVWKIRDNTVLKTINGTKDSRYFVVLKTMKPEHELIHRNFERHRREAATMSRLTKSPHVADLFAYCGNSILTEFATQDLSYALDTITKLGSNGGRNERRRTRNDLKEAEHRLRINNDTVSNSDGFESEGHSSSKEVRNDAAQNFAGLLTPSLSKTVPLATRLDWALQASKAIADLHRSDIIHADITTKQFLIFTSSGGTHGWSNNFTSGAHIKINDFNRCRFVPRRPKLDRKETSLEPENIASAISVRSKTTDRCTIRIPSAPGLYRSPEEYSDQPLTSKMDVFSLGHVLYEIWTSGQRPWQDVGGKRIKNMVMDGTLPNKLQMLKDWDDQSGTQLIANNTNTMNESFLFRKIEHAFGRVIIECYTVDPERRISADGLVQELARLHENLRNQNYISTKE